MSSSLAAGYTAEQASRTLNTRCQKSKTGKHRWKQMATGPSWWRQCKNCKADIYGK